MMDWNRLLTPKRFGLETSHKVTSDSRNEFQRDFDRLIFSAPFRRLQNKTQVFPLPGSVFVHNRLTHSLEVACVGRSLGNMVSNCLQHESPYWSEIGAIVSAACLAHDLGNPPFGHSGERAIGTFFGEGEGQSFRENLSDEQWHDCIHFEGNANAFRLLTHQFAGRRPGGFVLTYSTLASIVKYPYASIHSGGKPKFGFFCSEKDSYETMASELGICCCPDNADRYARHPLAFLVEAADDICYQIMDIEDAHKLRILTKDETIGLFIGFIDKHHRERIGEVCRMVTDTNEQIAYLRSLVIGNLVEACARAFVAHEEQILQGTFMTPLIDVIDDDLRCAYSACSDLAFNKIYRSQEVLDVELAGYKIIYTLLQELMQAVFTPKRAYSKQLLMRIPTQYEVNAVDAYSRIQAILDYISGMTDVYALDLYRKITGMSLPAL